MSNDKPIKEVNSDPLKNPGVQQHIKEATKRKKQGDKSVADNPDVPRGGVPPKMPAR
ncbi:MAG TPA: hypothetical protein VMV59_07065 [Candidatus Dormibacteraeota bacterium]|nr:hypothetical protein [Candidatus Dormibacteraeota bacterium]